MPTNREREYYAMGFRDGIASGLHPEAEGRVQARGGLIVPLGESELERWPGYGVGGQKPRRKRRKTAYQNAYSAAYKRLKKKHPRMAFGSLSKKAHAAARKKVK